MLKKGSFIDQVEGRHTSGYLVDWEKSEDKIRAWELDGGRRTSFRPAIWQCLACFCI